MERTQRRGDGSGFTLLEIMVVIALIGLIAGAVGVAVHKQSLEAKLKIARIQVGETLHVVESFTTTRERCPTLDELVSEGYVRKLPKDPWGNPLQLRCPGQHEKDPADVTSAGPDKQPGTGDDINSWEQ